MPKIVVEGPDGKKYAFPDTMPREEINAFMKQRYGTKARNETVQDYLARVVREQDATKARARDVTREATATGRAEGERAAERMGVNNPFEMAMAAPAIGLAQQSAGRIVYDREGTMLPDEAAALAAVNAAGFLVPGMVNRQFGERAAEGRRQQPGASFAGDLAGGAIGGEMINLGLQKVGQAVAPAVSQIGRLFKGKPAAAAPEPPMVLGPESRILPVDRPDALPGDDVAMAQALDAWTPPVEQQVRPMGFGSGSGGKSDPWKAASIEEFVNAQISRAKPKRIERAATAEEWDAAVEGAQDLMERFGKRGDVPGQRPKNRSTENLTNPDARRIYLWEDLAAAQLRSRGLDPDPVFMPLVARRQSNAERAMPNRASMEARDIANRLSGTGDTSRETLVNRMRNGTPDAPPPIERAATSDEYQAAWELAREQLAGGRGRVGYTRRDVENRADELLRGIGLDGSGSSVVTRQGGTENVVALQPRYDQDPKTSGILTERGRNAVEQTFGAAYMSGTGSVAGGEYDLNGDGQIDNTDRAIGSGIGLAAFASPLALRKVAELGGRLKGTKAQGMVPKLPETPQQAARYETPGSPEYEAAVAKGLDMSTPARMARAKEMGFDTETVLYHGTTRDFDQFDLSRSKNPSEQVVFLTPDPDSAGDFAMIWGSLEGKASPRVMPLVVRGRIKQLTPEDLPELQRPGNSGQLVYRTKPFARIIEQAKREGFDGVKVPNVYDVNRAADQVIIFDPANIRSVHAAFDPDKAASPILTAGFGSPAPRRTEAFMDDRLTPSENKALEMRRNGFSTEEIAEEMDTSTNTVLKFISTAKAKGVEVEPIKRGPPMNRTPDVLRLAEQGLRPNIIAERLGLTRNNVSVLLTKERTRLNKAGKPIPKWLNPRDPGGNIKETD